MKGNKYLTMITLGLLAWLIWVPGDLLAQGIPSVDNLDITARIFNSETTVDLTNAWWQIPEQTVVVKIEGLFEGTTIQSVELLGGTTNYPGICTNYPNPTDPDTIDPVEDFRLGDIINDTSSFELTPLDGGGKAVIQVTDNLGINYTFVLPSDTDDDGIADTYEIKYCGSATCLDPDADDDTGPDLESPVGDGIAAIDEYRGFRVSGNYVQGDPTRKDVFIHLASEAYCDVGDLETYLDDGIELPIKLATFFDDPVEIFANIDTLAPRMHSHYIGNDEWVTTFEDYTTDLGVVVTGFPTSGQWEPYAKVDRRINQNAIFPVIYNRSDGTSNEGIVKGIRIIECLDPFYGNLGEASKRPPDGWDNDDGNAIIYTQRIWKYFKEKFLEGYPRHLRYHTFEAGEWVAMEPTYEPPGPDVEQSNNDLLANTGVKFILQQALALYVAHEAAGHSMDLTPTHEGTKKVSYGYHHADGTGTNIDVAIVHVVDRKVDAFNNFYIPKTFAITDERNFRILESQIPLPQ